MIIDAARAARMTSARATTVAARSISSLLTNAYSLYETGSTAAAPGKAPLGSALFVNISVTGCALQNQHVNWEKKPGIFCGAVDGAWPRVKSVYT